MSRSLSVLGAMSCFVLGACSLPEDDGIRNNSRMVARQVEAHSNGFRAAEMGGSKFAIEYQHSDGQGRALPCQEMDLSVTVEYAPGGLNGTFMALDPQMVKVSCDKSSPFNLAIVVDNSGSQEEVLPEIRSGAAALARGVIEAGGKVSLTRVSTQASTLVELTENLEPLTQALAGTKVNQGWTALYDGIRLASEGLGRETLEESKKGVLLCRRARRNAIAVFTDGADNNSADQKNDKGSDGMATSIEDLMDLRHLGVKVPVFGIGMGDKVNQEVLESLAKASGGLHLSVDDHHGVGRAFERISDALRESVEVCADLPVSCGDVGVRVNYSYTVDGERKTESQTFLTEVECPLPAPKGRVATVMLSLSDPSLPPQFSQTLVKNTMDWILGSQPSASKKVLLVLDDIARREARGEEAFLHDAMRAAGYVVDVKRENPRGLRPKDIAGYDLVWFSNPGYPMDDWRTLVTLRAHVASGKALVLSGDDMSRANGCGFDLSTLTRLKYINNGHRSCGMRTDNGSRDGYTLAQGDVAHPIGQGLDYTNVVYKNDIDHTWPLHPGQEVLMWGKVDNGAGCTIQTPVVTAHVFE